MATRRSARKRGRGTDAETSTPKRPKSLKWEWLGDGGKWNQYSDTLGDKLTDSFINGEEEVILPVAPGVKMKVRFPSMAQMNVSTGYQRDLRCVPLDDESTDYKESVWEWEDTGTWKRYPINTNRQLEAAFMCNVDKVGVSVAMKPYTTSLHSNEMEDEASGRKWKIRRIDPDSTKNDTNYVWQWKDEHDVWNVYSDIHSQTLETAFENDSVSVNLVINGRSYTADLTKLEQINDSTKVNRMIRRAPRDTFLSSEESNKDIVKISSSTDSNGRVHKKVKRTTKNGDPGAGETGAKSSSTSSAPPTTSGSSTEENIKSQVFSGKCPIDPECKNKLGKAVVFIDGEDVWNCMLNQTNLKNNNNKFYLIQLLKDNGKNNYSVWFRWGRVGKAGQNQLQTFGTDLDSAKDAFQKKFYDKTHNSWEHRKSFKKVSGKYDVLEMDYEAKEEVDAPEEVEVKQEKESKLDKRIQELIELICNVQAMEEAVKEMKYDTKKAPLGKLTSAQIKFGYSALKKIDSLIQANKTSGDQLIKACDEFYTRIPHDFGMRRPPIINTKELVKEKLTLLEALGDIQIAMKLIQGGDKTEEHPIDRHYRDLHCELNPLSNDHDTVGLIKKYVKQTHGQTHTGYSLDVLDVYEISREGEEQKFVDYGNRMLLWHGSRLTNWVGILSQGLRIAPPEAPVTGYMFGKGLYFADMCSKSANYCFATPTRNEAVALLCEVSLGKPNELFAADYNADQLPHGKNSVKGLGRMAPNPAYNETLPNGCIVPLGPSHDTGIHNPLGYTLNYNEFIVYSTEQLHCCV